MLWSMASMDCMGMGVPVVAPRYAAYPEFIPSALLYDNMQHAERILNRLLDDEEFWLKCSFECTQQSRNLVPETIAAQLITVFKETLKG